MSAITTHVLDTSQGRPADGVPVTLQILTAEQHWHELARGTTNQDGRISDLLPMDYALEAGVYRMTFDTATYFNSHNLTGFYPFVPVIFQLNEPGQHYHIPLLLSPFGYSTYRGS